MFCKIAAGEIPKREIEHEEGAVVSFETLEPKRPGHTLVIPVDHYRWFYDLPDQTANQLFKAARTHAKVLREQTGADYIQMMLMGEAMPHVHVHLIPRHFNDGSIPF